MAESNSKPGLKPRLRRAAWRLGELVYRRVPDGVAEASGDSAPPLPEPVERGDSVPAHAPTDVESFRPRPLASAANPVLTAADVTDYGDVDFLADPFLFPGDSGWHLFFEVFNRDRRPTGVIGHAATTDGGRSWRYDRVVLEADVHLAYPYVFEWEGDFYMIPDRWNRETPAAIRVYRTDSLPGGWEPVSTVVDPDRQLADCTAFRWNDRWWAMLGSDDGRYDLCAYHADRLLEDEWTPHADNPVVSGRPEAARPGGRPIVGRDRIRLFLQDCRARYGDKVRAFEVERLSPTAYEDRERPESPVLSGSGRRLEWNAGQMHHIDPWLTADGWRCAVDGNIGIGRRVFGPDHWSLGLYRA